MGVALPLCVCMLCTAACVGSDASSHIISDAQAFQPATSADFLSKTSAAAAPPITPVSPMTAASSDGVNVANAQSTDPSSSSSMGVGTLVIIAVLATMALCCVLGCCMMKQICGCLFGGVEDAFDGDGQIGHTAQAEEAALAGLGGYELAGKSLF